MRPRSAPREFLPQQLCTCRAQHHQGVDVLYGPRLSSRARRKMSSKRRSTGASEVAPSEAESTSGRKRKASHTAPAPIKLPRLEFVAELEEKYSSLAKKAVAAAEKAAKGSSTATSKQQLQAVFEDVKTAAFGLLRAHCERADVADEGLCHAVPRVAPTRTRCVSLLSLERADTPAFTPRAPFRRGDRGARPRLGARGGQAAEEGGRAGEGGQGGPGEGASCGPRVGDGVPPLTPHLHPLPHPCLCRTARHCPAR